MPLQCTIYIYIHILTITTTSHKMREKTNAEARHTELQLALTKNTHCFPNKIEQQKKPRTTIQTKSRTNKQKKTVNQASTRIFTYLLKMYLNTVLTPLLSGCCNLCGGH